MLYIIVASTEIDTVFKGATDFTVLVILMKSSWETHLNSTLKQPIKSAYCKAGKLGVSKGLLIFLSHYGG